MLKKLFIALVFSSATFVWSGSSFAGGHCVGTTMNDAQQAENILSSMNYQNMKVQLAVR